MRTGGAFGVTGGAGPPATIARPSGAIAPAAVPLVSAPASTSCGASNVSAALRWMTAATPGSTGAGRPDGERVAARVRGQVHELGVDCGRRERFDLGDAAACQRAAHDVVPVHETRPRQRGDAAGAEDRAQ